MNLLCLLPRLPADETQRCHYPNRKQGGHPYRRRRPADQQVPQDPNNPKTKIPLETMKKTYYAARGWDKNGIPTEATLRRLKIK